MRLHRTAMKPQRLTSPSKGTFSSSASSAAAGGGGARARAPGTVASASVATPFSPTSDVSAFVGEPLPSTIFQTTISAEGHQDSSTVLPIKVRLSARAAAAVSAALERDGRDLADLVSGAIRKFDGSEVLEFSEDEGRLLGLRLPPAAFEFAFRRADRELTISVHRKHLPVSKNHGGTPFLFAFLIAAGGVAEVLLSTAFFVASKESRAAPRPPPKRVRLPPLAKPFLAPPSRLDALVASAVAKTAALAGHLRAFDRPALAVPVFDAETAAGPDAAVARAPASVSGGSAPRRRAPKRARADEADEGAASVTASEDARTEWADAELAEIVSSLCDDDDRAEASEDGSAGPAEDSEREGTASASPPSPASHASDHREVDLDTDSPATTAGESAPEPESAGVGSEVAGAGESPLAFSPVPTFPALSAGVSAFAEDPLGVRSAATAAAVSALSHSGSFPFTRSGASVGPGLSLGLGLGRSVGVGAGVGSASGVAEDFADFLSILSGARARSPGPFFPSGSLTPTMVRDQSGSFFR